VIQPKEPIFNVPPAVVATIAVLVLIHAFRALVLNEAEDARVLLTFAFIPARYDANLLVGGSFPGGWAADLWTPFTYALFHADLLHLGLNVAWLLPFGTALARRFGTWRYVAFMLATAAAGALAHLVGHAGQMVPMIGASAAVSGAMAAAMRFVFQRGGPLGLWRPGDPDAYRVPAIPLLATFRDMRFLVFLGAWVGLNAVFGLGTLPLVGEGQDIAWQAHIGGFAAGLILFAAFDPVGRRVPVDSEPTA
jgi:membrane associated rhomboid family serine protease